MLLLALLKHQFVKTYFDQSLLSEVPRDLSLTIHQKIEAIFQSVLSTTFHELRNLRPFFRTLKLQDILQQPTVFLNSPRAFLNVRIKEAIPVLSALFSSPKYFVIGGVFFIKFFRDQLPVNLRVLSYDVTKQFGLMF